MSRLRWRKFGGGRSYRIPSSFCGHCGRLWTGAGNPRHGHEPRPGDITVCIGCAGVSEFDSELRLVARTADELAAAYAAQPGLGDEVRRMQRTAVAAIAAAIAETGEAPRGAPVKEGRA